MMAGLKPYTSPPTHAASGERTNRLSAAKAAHADSTGAAITSTS